MLWKVYFWIYSILTFIGLVYLFPQIPSFNFASWEGTFESAILIIGTFAYIYCKNILPSTFWRAIFITISVIWTAQLIYYSNILPVVSPFLKFLETYPPQDFLTLVITLVVSVPALLAVYKLGIHKSLTY